jgi:hypothetical protein
VAEVAVVTDPLATCPGRSSIASPLFMHNIDCAVSKIEANQSQHVGHVEARPKLVTEPG